MCVRVEWERKPNLIIYCLKWKIIWRNFVLCRPETVNTYGKRLLRVKNDNFAHVSIVFFSFCQNSLQMYWSTVYGCALHLIEDVHRLSYLPAQTLWLTQPTDQPYGETGFCTIINRWDNLIYHVKCINFFFILSYTLASSIHHNHRMDLTAFGKRWVTSIISSFIWEIN